MKNEDDSFYTIDVNVPAIKLNTQVAADLNAEFKNEFYQNALSYMVQTTQHIYYTVTYQAFYRDNYLSLVIKSSLKEGNNAESVVVRAIAPVTDVDILRAGYNWMSVNNGAKGTKFVLLVNRLQESFCI